MHQMCFNTRPNLIFSTFAKANFHLKLLIKCEYRWKLVLTVWASPFLAQKFRGCENYVICTLIEVWYKIKFKLWQTIGPSTLNSTLTKVIILEKFGHSNFCCPFFFFVYFYLLLIVFLADEIGLKICFEAYSNETNALLFWNGN